MCRTTGRHAAVSSGHLDQRLLEFPTQHMLHPEVSQHRLVELRIESIATQRRGRVQRLHPTDDRHRQPCGRVHRKMEGNQIGVERRRTKRLAGQVDRRDVNARLAQPGGWRRQPERLSPELVGGDQGHPHRGVARRPRAHRVPAYSAATSSSLCAGVARLTTMSVAIDSASAG